MDATQMFLIRHERLHAHVRSLTDGLSEDQVRNPVYPGTTPLAWLLWHVARGEDGAVSLLVCDTSQIVDDEWLARLDVKRRDVGTGMSTDEVLELCRKVDLSALMAYWDEVGDRTHKLLTSLPPATLDEVVSDDRLHRAVTELVKGPAAPRLENLWKNTTRGHFLVWLPLTHNYEHVGQADFIRGMLGQPGPF